MNSSLPDTALLKVSNLFFSAFRVSELVSVKRNAGISVRDVGWQKDGAVVWLRDLRLIKRVREGGRCNGMSGDPIVKISQAKRMG